MLEELVIQTGLPKYYRVSRGHLSSPAGFYTDLYKKVKGSKTLEQRGNK
jgi:hypothetical protein